MKSPPPNDLVFHITLLRGNDDLKPLQPSVWRRFRCSAGMNLDVFQDKILTPIMGWSRNYHTYYFRQDDIYYYQSQMSAVDTMHGHKVCVGGTVVHPSEYSIGDLFHDEGDSCFYAYDLGDDWYHKITCMKVIPHQSEDQAIFGKARVLDGRMRCPPEDGEGGRHYQKTILDKWNKVHAGDRQQQENTRNRRKLADDLSKACFDEVKALNVREPFLPDDFTVIKQQEALEAALHSRDSARCGSKQFTTGGHNFPCQLDCTKACPGQRKTMAKLEMPGDCTISFTKWSLLEMVNLKPDENPLCGACGNPHDVKTCGRCHMVGYCCRDCQIEDWPRHKKECKSLKAKYKTYMKEEAGEVPVPQGYMEAGANMLQRYDPNNLRFRVGDVVECCISETDYAKGKVIKLHYTDKQMLGEMIAPYQVQIFAEECRRYGMPHNLIFAMWDDDFQIREPIENDSSRQRSGIHPGSG